MAKGEGCGSIRVCALLAEHSDAPAEEGKQQCDQRHDERFGGQL